MLNRNPAGDVDGRGLLAAPSPKARPERMRGYAEGPQAWVDAISILVA